MSERFVPGSSARAAWSYNEESPHTWTGGGHRPARSGLSQSPGMDAQR